MEVEEVNTHTGDRKMPREEIHFERQKEQIRKRLLKYTRKAFQMLPKLDSPRILDVGCGSGIPTMELARLSNGEITGLDIDQSALEMLAEKIARAGLSDIVKTMRRSALDMEFPEESFDIIWSEGSIFSVGFERGLREWKRFLKPNGFMVVHDETGNVTEKLQQISGCGYQLLDHFALSQAAWRTEYFTPLGKLVRETRDKYRDNPQVIEQIRDARQEIDFFNQNPERCSSIYFVMQKKY